MNGKNVIVVGAGSYRLRYIWCEAAKYGIKIILVEANPNHAARATVHRFIHYDFSDHSNDTLHACEIFNIIQNQGIHVDGCVSFTDEFVPLASLINKRLGTRGISYEAATVANSKSRTQNVLLKSKTDTFLNSSEDFLVYSTRALHLKTESDCDILPESLKFPMVLKLDNGSGAVGACNVKNKTEMKTKFRQITSTLRTDSDFPGIGLSQGNSICAMEFYSGTEHIVDVIIYNGKLITAFISDNGMPRRPYFLATARRMPSFLPEAKREQLIEAAYKCCVDLGLSHGTFNVEFMMTENGPKLLEINPRMGGYCLRQWLMEVYDIDIMLVSMMIACNIKPCLSSLSPHKILMGVMVIPSLHSKILKEEHLSKLLNTMIEKGDIFFLHFREISDISSSYEKPFGNVAVSGSTEEETKRKLMEVCDLLEINCDDYLVEQFIKKF